MLPEIKRVKLPENIFPTKWQTVIFRNYGLVSIRNLATMLRCDEETITREAARLGLAEAVYNGDWERKGYITIIRNNWYLLPYSQLIQLLNISRERLDYILQNDDFLAVKLGNFKPECEEIYYALLTQEQEAETQTLVATLEKTPNRATPFDFFKEEVKNIGIKSAQGTRLVHGYLSPCGDAFSEDNEEYLPEALLAEYAKQGVNALWWHGALSTLSPYPFDEKLSKGYEARRTELKRLIARLKKYGIKLYLYINEPRALPVDKIGKYGHLIGRKENGFACLCFEQKETQEYLYNAIKDLLTEVPDIGGFLSITMSENPTHCNFLPNTNCPICKNIPPQQSTSAVNNVIQKAIKDSGSTAELIAYLWGWSPYMGWTVEQALNGIERLDKGISTMCVSEYDLPIIKGGVESRIIDYSISNPGPSDITKQMLGHSLKTGHTPYAKIQINDSWECSAVPYLPVFDLTYQHLKNLADIDVRNYMLTWTLGGYPSPTMNMIAAFAEQKEKFNLDEWYQQFYGEQAAVVHEAVKLFCEGFKEYPFSIQSLYLSPKTLGAAHLWSLEREEKESTMVCYAFDDFERWIYPYPYEIYVSQYEKLLKRWGQGCDELQKLPQTELLEELKIYAKTAQLHFESDLLQTKFSYYKRDIDNNKKELQAVVVRAQEVTKELLSLVQICPYIGFETSNHYFYNARNLQEKLLNLKQLYEKL